MDSVLALIAEYGNLVYAILFGYCALKSGWLPLFAGYAAHTGAVSVSIVAIATFAGGYLGDELRFAIARHWGVSWVNSGSRIDRLLKRAMQLAQRYGAAYVYLYRYPKGLRTIGALPVGLTPITWRRFTLLNASSALLWSVVMVGGGYAFGASFEAFGIENLTILSLLLLVLFITSLTHVWRPSSQQKDIL
ncbi:MAG: VTT domain-containing protein [Pseudomonadota bacterium]